MTLTNSIPDSHPTVDAFEMHILESAAFIQESVLEPYKEAFMQEGKEPSFPQDGPSSKFGQSWLSEAIDQRRSDSTIQPNLIQALANNHRQEMQTSEPTIKTHSDVRAILAAEATDLFLEGGFINEGEANPFYMVLMTPQEKLTDLIVGEFDMQLEDPNDPESKQVPVFTREPIDLQGEVIFGEYYIPNAEIVKAAHIMLNGGSAVIGKIKEKLGAEIEIPNGTRIENPIVTILQGIQDSLIDLITDVPVDLQNVSWHPLD